MFDTEGHDKQQGVPALRFHINSPHPAPVPFPHDTVVAPWNPLLGRWYHVAVTRSGSSYALYIDGAQVATDTSIFSIPDPGAPLTIGRAEGVRLNGLVDEVEIFNRALAASEIQTIFNAGSAGKCKPVRTAMAFPLAATTAPTHSIQTKLIVTMMALATCAIHVPPFSRLRPFTISLSTGAIS